MEYLLLVGLIVGLIYWISALNNAKAEYHEALNGTGKRKALELGRRYYRLKRGKGKLTIYDEQAITNDLAAMDDANKKQTPKAY
ncbi:MAG: hypothetical protein J0I09_03900 [Sphingobacteriia bacterium]|nr:hypothetical protein [Sphingobacteriia bacterium]